MLPWACVCVCVCFFFLVFVLLFLVLRAFKCVFLSRVLARVLFVYVSPVFFTLLFVSRDVFSYVQRKNCAVFYAFYTCLFFVLLVGLFFLGVHFFVSFFFSRRVLFVLLIYIFSILLFS